MSTEDNGTGAAGFVNENYGIDWVTGVRTPVGAPLYLHPMTPLGLIIGRARQCGKTAMVMRVGKEEGSIPTAWLTDRGTLHFDKEDARRDCDGFIEPLFK